MKELVVISGKGGTGKTSLTASFAVLAQQAVVADCDVDAADLHLVLSPEVKEGRDFYSGHEAIIRQSECIGCGACLANCRFGAVKMNGEAAGEARFSIDAVLCEGCGVCVRFCPVHAIDFPERLCGQLYISQCRTGPMVHARLGAAAENSGKLVSTVRREARRIADEQDRPMVIVDGPPGIGCPVIASVTGATMVLAVTEPSVSGKHDLERVLSLTRHFDIPAAVCVNKYDINPEAAKAVEKNADSAGAAVVGRIPYDPAVTAAQMDGSTIVEHNKGPAADAVAAIWEALCRMI